MAKDKDSMPRPKKNHSKEVTESPAITKVSIDVSRSHKLANAKSCKVSVVTQASEKEVQIDPLPEECGFEALLRPLRDITLNWDFKIQESLEMYISSLNNERRKFSFAEAAMIVSNSTTVYCRRVDSLFKLIVDLVESLTKCSIGEDSAETEGSRSRRKKGKDLINEDMTDIGFATDCNSVNLSVEKLETRMVDVKPVILNTSMKIITKDNTSCLIYVTKGVDLGYKNEFRLHWYKSSDGVLYEDFNYNSLGVELGWRDRSKITFTDNLDDSKTDVEMGDPGIEQESDLGPVTADSTFINMCAETNLLGPDRFPIATSPEKRVEEIVKDKKTKSPTEEWAKAPYFNFKIPLLPFKKKKVYKLPVEIFKKAEKMKKRKRGPESYIVYLDIVGEAATNTPIYNKVLVEAKYRKKCLAESRLTNDAVEVVADKDFEGDGDDASIADVDPVDDLNESDNEGNVGVDGSQVDIGGLRAPLDERLSREEHVNRLPSYEDNRQQIMMDYQQAKKAHATKSTEVAKRVAEWHELLQPILAKSEERSKFDVQVYGSKILDLFPSEEECPVKKFQDLVRGQPKEEICRYFLSTLMLANTYNVEIVRTNEEDLCKDCMELKLLSRVRHHKELDDNLRVTSEAANYE